ncbi:PKS-NRPS hybrid synthetase cheA-like [Diospyros lotus]|uniref:PKS-NRPS hybrid synthetase cheA-like n=1 Tax=Diospyros lotus TaxID=55363 RepID=UPI00224E701A|nr:PKS-NRPS hybrid synthetase cheA-like [Diospyros lotus]
MDYYTKLLTENWDEFEEEHDSYLEKEYDAQTQWELKVICGVHNHPLAVQLEGHSYAGRLTEKEKGILKTMSENLVKPRNILMSLKVDDENNVTTIKTIYNARQRYKLIEKGGRSQMQQLMKKLRECNYVEWHRTDGSNCIGDLFWAHPMSIDLLKIFPHVLIMDCTYKTNRYRYPLLEIVGVTSTELTFPVAFVFMNHEYEDNYTWAMERLKNVMGSNACPGVIVTDRELALMNAIYKVFPSTTTLLCRWHISKNILAKCKKFFDRKETWEKFMLQWNLLVFASTEIEYQSLLSDLMVEYHAYEGALDYVRNTWLNDYKEKFIAAWTNKVLHFGNVTTNRAESAYVKLKRYLGSSQGDFESSWKIINSLIELQHTEIKGSFEKSLILVQHNFRSEIFRELRGIISRNAMNMVSKQTEMAQKIGVDKVACRCVIRSTHGLPCAHEIAELMMEGRPIPLSFVHPYWTKLDLVNTVDVSSVLTIDPELESLYNIFQSEPEGGKIILKQKLRELIDPTTTSLIPPSVKVRTKGKPSLKKKIEVDTSTRRDPSYFEIVQSIHDSISPTIQSSVKTLNEGKLYRTSVKQRLLGYDASFPSKIRHFIHNIVNVESDGHCGFRAIAALLGMSEHNWRDIRMNLIGELHTFRDEYIELYGSAMRVDELMHALSCFECVAPPQHWMTLPDMGHLIASKYNVVLVHLSRMQCLTYLPLRSAAPSVIQHRIITIGFVDDCHFVQVHQFLLLHAIGINIDMILHVNGKHHI